MGLSKARAVYFPLYFIVAFIVLTLGFFKFGTVEWLTPNTGKVIVFVLAAFLFFSAGYIFVIKKQKPMHEAYLSFDYLKAVRVLFVIGAVSAIAYYVTDIIITYGNHAFDYARYPGAAYDFAEYLQRLYAQGSGFEYPMWFRYITRFHTLCFGIVLSGLTWGLFYFKRFKAYEKALWGLLLLVYLIRSWMTAAQSYFFILLFICITFFLYKIYRILNSAEERNKIARKIFIQSLALVVVAIICMTFVYIFQNDRSIQRDIRVQLRNNIIEKGYEFDAQIYEKTVLDSINIRLGKEVFEVRYGFEGTCANASGEPDFSKNVSVRKGAEVLEIGSIDKYYVLDKENSILYKINPRLYFAVQSVEMYATQGYGALGLSFEHDFDWTYLIGNSRFVTNFIDEHFGTNIFERTYIYKNEQVFNWSSTTYWQSLYAWLASDFTYYGVILVFGFIGMLYAKVWLEVIRYRNPFAFAMMFMMVFGIMMASANNLLFQDLGLCIATSSVIILFALSLILRKRKAKKQLNASNEK